MKRNALAILVSLAVICCLCPASALAQDQAMVTEVKGDQVLYQSGSKAGKKVGLMDFLTVGDKITLGPRTSLSLNYFSSGNRERISGPGTLTVGRSGSQPGEGLKIESSKAVYLPPKADLKDYDVQQTATVALRGKQKQPGRARPSPLERRASEYRQCLKGGPAVKGLFQTGVRSTRPLLSWAPVAGAESYKVRFLSFQDRQLIEGVTEHTAFPLVTAGLVRGNRYKWEVLALAGGRTLARSQGWFWVLSEDSLEELTRSERKIKAAYDQGSTEGRLALAMLYHGHGLFDEEADVLKEILERDPDHNNLAAYLRVLDPSVK